MDQGRPGKLYTDLKSQSCVALITPEVVKARWRDQEGFNSSSIAQAMCDEQSLYHGTGTTSLASADCGF